MSARSYVKISSGRLLNPQENPSSIHNLSDFKSQTISKNMFDNVLIRPKKTITIGIYEEPRYPNQANQNHHYYFNTAEGNYNKDNSYIQPSLSGNYILPNGSIYFDERLNLDYIDRAVRTTEDNAYLAQIASQNANLASHHAFNDAERATHALDYNVLGNGRKT